MGVVWTALDERLHRHVAIKALLRTEDGSQGTVLAERVLNEARALAALSHANVASVHDVVEQAGVWYIVMELVGDTTPTTAWARLVNEPCSDATGLTFDAAIALEESGAIMGWGWRPYVRVRRIVAGSDGTGIIMQTRPNRVVRVIVTDLSLNKTARLWQYGTTTPLFTFRNDGSVNHNDAYVDLLDNGAGSVTLLTPTPIAISTNSEAMSLYATMVALLK
jgi:hypothetical protein